jgi:hypothetical protein
MIVYDVSGAYTLYILALGPEPVTSAWELAATLGANLNGTAELCRTGAQMVFDSSNDRDRTLTQALLLRPGQVYHSQVPRHQGPLP